MYIQMISLHGLVKTGNIEMGRDADTGGQIRYVMDLIKALSRQETVSRIDLFTRQIRDKRVSAVYSRHIEVMNAKCRIVRLSCGGSRYIRKEKLWPHLDEFVDRMIAFTRKEQLIPDLVHGHYADGGYIAREIALIFGLPLLFTAHSLGRNKLEYLLASGWSQEKADRTFAIDHRIEVEETVLGSADLVITSTRYERDQLYRSYLNRELPGYRVIPPGLEFDRFFPYYEYELPSNSIPEQQKRAYITMQHELQRFYSNPEKPLILSLCRPDARKNIDLLIKIYGQDAELQALANLAIFAGIRDDINTMEDSEKQVLTDILLLMDRYDLYGKLAIPKHHHPLHDVPELYRIAAHKRGVFVSTSFLENFGLTLIEAAATGLPFIASDRGGPKDIVANCRNGILVDLDHPKELVKAIKEILLDPERWKSLSASGIEKTREFYTWDTHCETYITAVQGLSQFTLQDMNISKKEKTIGKRLSQIEFLFITDIDDTLIGESKELDHFREFYQQNHDRLGFGVATGRPVSSVRELLKELDLGTLDIIISSVGTEIYYGDTWLPDKGWANHINRKWRPEKIREVLTRLNCITLQPEEETQRRFKISYNLQPGTDCDYAIPEIHNTLMNAHLAYNLIFSHGTYIDIIPFRASKGRAVRYMSAKWKILLEKIITAGNSGNDRDMLTGTIFGIIVGNHEEELGSLKHSNRTYFAAGKANAGIMEGLIRYNALFQADLRFPG